MVKLYNITDWYEIRYFNTGGTRNKKIYINPEDQELYFFKESFKKGNRDYKYEFWSEIIASEIGLQLGFDILQYHIAIRGDTVGCISKSMIKQASEELIEGGKYLQAFDSTFNPENVKLRHQYNFELIQNALVYFNKKKHLEALLDTIVFDALIGNSDRHQENWAIINTHSIVSGSLSTINQVIVGGKLHQMSNWLKKLFQSVYMKKDKLKPELESARLYLPKETKFAPIYDSGCSFGRELSDERITEMLADQKELDKYVAKGQSEIHWNSTKISHFELVNNLLHTEAFKKKIITTLKRVFEQFDTTKINATIQEIDNPLVELGRHSGLPQERKDLVKEMLTLRFNKLRELYSQHT